MSILKMLSGHLVKEVCNEKADEGARHRKIFPNQVYFQFSTAGKIKLTWYLQCLGYEEVYDNLYTNYSCVEYIPTHFKIPHQELSSHTYNSYLSKLGYFPEHFVKIFYVDPNSRVIFTDLDTNAWLHGCEEHITTFQLKIYETKK